MEISRQPEDVGVPQVGLYLHFSLKLVLHPCFLQLGFKQHLQGQENLLLLLPCQVNISELSFTQGAAMSKPSRVHCLFSESSVFCFDACPFSELFPEAVGCGCSLWWGSLSRRQVEERWQLATALSLASDMRPVSVLVKGHSGKNWKDTGPSGHGHC